MIKSLITSKGSDLLLRLARLEELEPPTGCLEGGLRHRREQPRRSSQAIFVGPRLTALGRDGPIDRTHTTGTTFLIRRKVRVR